MNLNSIIFYRYTPWYKLMLLMVTAIFLFSHKESFFLNFLSIIPLVVLIRKIAENVNLLPKKPLVILNKDVITVPEAFTFGFCTKIVPWESVKEITVLSKRRGKYRRKVIELSLGKRTFWYHDSVDISVGELEVSPSEFLMHAKKYYNGKCFNLLG